MASYGRPLEEWITTAVTGQGLSPEQLAQQLRAESPFALCSMRMDKSRTIGFDRSPGCEITKEMKMLTDASAVPAA